MSQSNFSGPIQTGSDATPGSETFGTVLAVQRRSVSADGVYAPLVLPACHITEIITNVEVPYTVTAQTTLRFGTSADVTFYGSVNVSSVGRYHGTALSAINMINLATETKFVVDVTSVGAAGDGQASVYVHYLQRDV